MISAEEYQELANRYPMFSKFKPRLQQAFQQDAWPVRFPPGRLLFDIGWNCHTYILVTSGNYRVITYQESRELLLYVVKPGDCCMMSTVCLLGGSSHLSCGITETDLSGIAITRDFFNQLMVEAPDFREFTFQCFGERLTRLLSIIQELAFHTMERRLATLLLTKGDWVSATHQRLADEIGTVREVVSRNLKDLEARGILRLERGQIHILDRSALEKISRPDNE